jgi:hypothetical protein
VPAATPELSLESEAVGNAYRGATPDPGTPRDTLHVIPQEAHRKPDFQRPVWLSPEIVAFVVSASDWCLVLAAAAAAFPVYFGFMGPDGSAAGASHPDLVFGRNVHASPASPIWTTVSTDSRRAARTCPRTPMTWGFTLAVLLLAAFLSKTSESSKCRPIRGQPGFAHSRRKLAQKVLK